MDPQEIIAKPLELWIGTTGTAFPTLDDSPGDSNWTLLGEAGDKNYTEDGVTLNLAQTIEEWTPAGGTMARKAFRTNESLEFSVVVADITAEVMALVFNDNPVIEDATVVTKEVSLLRGLGVAEHSLVARGASPYDNDLLGQFQVPRCYMSSEPSVVYAKGEPAGIEFTFKTLDPEDNGDDFALVYQTPSA